MNALRGLAWLLVFQSAGEALSRGLSLPFPGPVVGMLLLLVGLFHPKIRESVAGCADFLLNHLSLLFVPVGVGVMTHLDLLESYGVRMMLVIALSTWAGLAVTASVLHALRDKPPVPPLAPLSPLTPRASAAPPPTVSPPETPARFMSRACLTPLAPPLQSLSLPTKRHPRPNAAPLSHGLYAVKTTGSTHG